MIELLTQGRTRTSTVRWVLKSKEIVVLTHVSNDKQTVRVLAKVNRLNA